jgi:hypothetical protein
MLCLINREQKLTNWEIPFLSKNIEKIWGSGEVSLSEGTLSISNVDPYKGLIVSEIN